MSEHPVVSICIANFNGQGVIDDCIQSILKQVGGISYEVLVHDDASHDESVAHIQSRYPDVKLIESKNNVGFCVANNRMADMAQGKYLLLLNNDAALYPDALQTLFAEAEHLSQPAILSLPQYSAATGELIDLGCLLDPFFNPVPNLDLTRQDVAMVIGACLWINKGLWNEIGGFPEWFGSIAEDMYLCSRARLGAYRVVVLANSGYLHRVGHSFGGGKELQGKLSSTLRRRALSERNKTFVIAICQPSPFWFPVLLIHALLLVVEGVTLSLAKLNTEPWHTIYAPVIPQLWLERHRWFGLRRIAQNNRQCTLSQWFSVFCTTPRKLSMLIRYGMPDVR